MPVKIQTIDISLLDIEGLPLPPDAGVEVDPGVPEGYQIDPEQGADQIDQGPSVPARAHIWLSNENSVGKDFTVLITFTFVPWNQYVPGP